MEWLTVPLAAAATWRSPSTIIGNNFVDGYHAEGFAAGGSAPATSPSSSTSFASAGSAQLGAAGFSIGGYTAAALLRCAGRRGPVRGAVLGDVARDAAARVPDARGRAARASDRRRHCRLGLRLGPRLLGRASPGRLSASARGRPDARRGEPDRDRPSRQRALVRSRRHRAAAGQRRGVPEHDSGCDGALRRASVGHYAFLADNAEWANVVQQAASEAVDFFDTHLQQSRLLAPPGS